MINFNHYQITLKCLLDRFVNRLAPMCMNGGHRQRGGIVTNVYGHKYCWHQDCMTANFKEIKDKKYA